MIGVASGERILKSTSKSRVQRWGLKVYSDDDGMQYILGIA